MAKHTINTSHPRYVQLREELRDLRETLRPHLRRYFAAPPEEKARWRAADPLLDGLLTFCERVHLADESNV